MDKAISILTMVDLTEGAASVPKVIGVYSSHATAVVRALECLMKQAREWGLTDAAVDGDVYRVADELGVRCVQMGINEVYMSMDAKFEVL